MTKKKLVGATVREGVPGRDGAKGRTVREGVTVKTVMPGVTVREGAKGCTVRYCCMVNMRRFSKMSDLPYEVLVERGRPTKMLKQDYAKWQDECAAKSGNGSMRGLREPTIRELITTWEDMAWKRNADPDYRRPKERTIRTAIKNVGYCLEASGLRDSRPYTELVDIDMIRKLFNVFREKGKKGISAKSYVCSLQTMTARWTIIEYRDRGFDVKPCLIPDFGKAAKAPTYHRLDKEHVAKIEKWYLELMAGDNTRMKLGATLIYNLAIRPNDQGVLTHENFPQDGEHHRLKYLPQKTNESSGRWVDIEIPDALYEEIREMSGERWENGETLLKSVAMTFKEINESMRDKCDMPVEKWPKAAYELRKLCLDTVMRQQGIDQAIKLSADRRETLEHYYVDPYKGTVPLMRVAPTARTV